MVIKFEVESINVVRGTSNSDRQLSSGNIYSVPHSSNIKLGRYYEISSLTNFIYGILKKYNVPQLAGEVYQNGMKYISYITNKADFYKYMQQKTLKQSEVNAYLGGKVGEYIHTDDLIAIMPKIVQEAGINLAEFELVTESKLDYKKSGPIVVGQTITGVKVIEKERKKETNKEFSTPNYVRFEEYPATNMIIQAEPELINDDEYETKHQKYMEAALRASEAVLDYVNTKTEDIKEIYHNVKENVKRIIEKNPEKAKKVAKNTIFTIAVIATLITGTAKLSKGVDKESRPETPPQQTAIADLSPYAETDNNFYREFEEVEIQEITIDDLKDNIILGYNYNLSEGTPIAASYTSEPTGILPDDQYTFDRITLYDSTNPEQKITIDAKIENKETGTFEYSEYYGKSISEIATQNGLDSYAVSLHTSEKNHLCEDEYSKGWISEDKIEEAFKDLANKLQNEPNKTGGKRV